MPRLMTWRRLKGVLPLVWFVFAMVFFVLVLLTGCATTHPTVDAPPLAEDLGWSAPVPVRLPTPEESPRPAEPEKPRSAKEKVYAFAAGESYRVDVPVGAPMDVILQPGEAIRDLADGDRSPMDSQDQKPHWEFKPSYSGEGPTGRPHVLITVPKAGLKNGLTLTTTKRTYYLDLRSVLTTAARSVRWTYTDEPPTVAKVPSRLWPDPSQTQRYHTGYEIGATTPPPVWIVRQVVDDGQKTYLIFPRTVTTVDAPLVRLIGSHGPEMVNARQAGNVVILDRLFNRAELRLGTGKTAQVVTVQRRAPQTITCPPLESAEARPDACPLWPDAVVRATP
jgi:type IV secretory pathway VirB9-like protein